MYRLVHAYKEPEDYVQPYTLKELLKLIDKASNTIKASHRSSVPNTMSSKPIYSFFVTGEFEKAVKKLKKLHKDKEIQDLKEVVTLLATEGTVNGRFGDHRVGNKYRELKLGDTTDVLLVYDYVPGADIISLSIKIDDITDHRNLNKNIKKKTYTPKKEYLNDENFNVDDIIDSE